MNLNDKNIDQLFRDAAQNSDGPRYDHSYWKEMSSVLSDQDKRKRGVILWSVAGSIVSVLLVSALFLTNNKNSDSLLVNNESLFTSSTQNTIKDKSFDKTIPSENSSIKAEAQKLGTDKINKIESKDNKSSRSISSAILEKGSNTSRKKSLDSSTDITANNGYAVNLDSQNPKTNRGNSVDEEDLLLEKNSIEINTESNDDLSIQALLLRKVSMQKLDVKNGLVPFKLLKDSPINFYTKLSAGLMENYETSRPFQSGVFDLSLNVEYVKNQVLFRTGVGFQATSNADLVVSERAKVYGFGITTHQNNLSYQSLYDIYIPLELGYSLNNTSFGFGAQINYMLGTTMNHESLENKVVVDENKLKGFSDGLNSLTAQGYIWLEQKISNRFAAGVKVGTNLNSRIKEGKYFNESATTNPLYGQLTLRFNLNK
jgi:hypothetical protein